MHRAEGLVLQHLDDQASRFVATVETGGLLRGSEDDHSSEPFRKGVGVPMVEFGVEADRETVEIWE